MKIAANLLLDTTLTNSSLSKRSSSVVDTDEASVDSSSGPGSLSNKKVYRRSYKACINCRTKKIKCDLGDLSNPSEPPCARCRREGRKCEFSVSRRGGAGNVRAGRQKKSVGPGAPSGIGNGSGSDNRYHHHQIGSINIRLTNNGNGDGISGNSSSGSSGGLPLDGAALSAAAVAVVASGTNRSYHQERKSADYGGSYNRSVPGNIVDGGGDLSDGKEISEENDIAVKELHNTSDALDILAQAARNYPKLESPPSPQVPQPESSVQEQKVFQPKYTIADTEIIKEKKFLTEHEAVLFIKYFFEQLHPFYPFISEDMHSTEVLAQMPILLVVILTISSRYCKFAEKGTKYFISLSRGSQIHSNLWDYCQQLISQTVWAEASTRSIGTVYSFLLISEWNPRAIHWRFNDYANSPRPIPTSSAGSTPLATPEWNDANKGSNSNGNNNSQDYNNKDPLPQAFYPPKLPGDNGFDASKRSDRMSWLLIGTAIRLAQDIGVMETNSNIYVATHLSETVLALRLGRRAMLSSSGDDEFLNLEFTPFQQAKLAILKIMSLAHETLYLSRKNTRELLQGGRFLAFLNLFGPHLNNWENIYRPLFDEPGLERESILFDFHYTRLYIYSLALSNKSAAVPDISNGRPSGMLSDVLTATRYVGIATDAAREMLAIVSRVYEMDKLRLAPIRWIVRAVHAAVFLVKTVLLTPPTSMYLHKATISIIRKTAITLKDSSPDDVHLANRYSVILLNLCDDMMEKYHKSNKEVEQLSLASSSKKLASSKSIEKSNVGGSKDVVGIDLTLSEPTVATVASVVNSAGDLSSNTSMSDQRRPVLALEGLLHPVNQSTSQPTQQKQSQQPQQQQSDVFIGPSGSTDNNTQFGSGADTSFLNEAVSFDYSRYNNFDDPQLTSQAPQQSAYNTTLNDSYMQFGLAPIVGTSSSTHHFVNNNLNGASTGTDNRRSNNSGASGLGFGGTSTSMADFNFDFWMEGSEGLGFVDQLVNSVEQQQIFQQKQRMERKKR